MYNEVIQLLPLLERNIQNKDLATKKQISEFLTMLTRKELWITNTIARIGATARGVRMHQDFSEQGRSTSFFKIPIANIQELLDRYSKYMQFYEKEDFMNNLIDFSCTFPTIQAGLSILKECMENEEEVQKIRPNWPSFGQKILYTPSEVQLVQMDDYTDQPLYFLFKKDVAANIKELQLEFGQWLGDLEKIHPFHRFYEEWTRNGDLYYRGYVHEYSYQDFIDWLNTDKYGRFVAHQTDRSVNAESAIHLSF